MIPVIIGLAMIGVSCHILQGFDHVTANPESLIKEVDWFFRIGLMFILLMVVIAFLWPQIVRREIANNPYAYEAPTKFQAALKTVAFFLIAGGLIVSVALFAKERQSYHSTGGVENYVLRGQQESKEVLQFHTYLIAALGVAVAGWIMLMIALRRRPVYTMETGGPQQIMTPPAAAGGGVKIPEPPGGPRKGLGHEDESIVEEDHHVVRGPEHHDEKPAFHARSAPLTEEEARARANKKPKD